ncbi:MAG: hypothetical protein AAFX50_13700, partial [Acidobacteriota bacterium]
MKIRRGPGVALALALAGAALAQPPPETPPSGDAQPVLLERIVAVVDDDPIFLSDLERSERWAPPPAP